MTLWRASKRSSTTARSSPVADWRTLSRRPLLELGRFLRVEVHDVIAPNGEHISDWAWVETPDYVNVAVVTEAGAWLCFRQGKYGLDGDSLAPVGGYVEEGEAPLQAAQREVLEESGYEASRWQSLGSYRVDANRGAGTAHLFFARGARRVAAPQSDDLEPQELLTLSRQEVAQALARGDFRVLAWAAVMALALAQDDL